MDGAWSMGLVDGLGRRAWSMGMVDGLGRWAWSRPGCAVCFRPVGVFTQIAFEDVAKFVAEYSLGDLKKVRGIEAGSVNSNFVLESPSGPLFLRVYEEQPVEGAKAEAQLLGALAVKGVKTAAPLRRKDGELVGLLAGKPAAVFPWASGQMRCQKSVRVEDGFAVGKALAEVHQAGEGLPISEGRFRPEDLFERLQRIAGAKDADLAAQAKPLEQKLHHWLARRDPGLPQGLTHGDLFRDNVLWHEDGTLSALLDFESACRGSFAYDIMVTMLSWSFGDSFEGDIAASIFRGYSSVRPLSPQETQGLLAEGAVACLRFTVTRITDYAMRAGIGPRVMKDWRRFAQRLDHLERLGQEGLAALVPVSRR